MRFIVAGLVQVRLESLWILRIEMPARLGMTLMNGVVVGIAGMSERGISKVGVMELVQ